MGWRRLQGEPPYMGRRRREALGRASLRAGGGDAYGTSLHGGPETLTGQASLRGLRDGGAVGRASLRAGGGGAYGTSLLTERASCAEALMDEPHYERIFFKGRRRLRDASL